MFSLKDVQNHFKKYASDEPLLSVEKLGSAYGGWWVPTSLFRSNWICYLGGVGEDISFDLELINRFNCKVFAFDPTPKAIKYIASKAADIPLYNFMPVGLWSKNTRLKFWAPKEASHVSHSVVNLQKTSTFFEADCLNLTTIMNKLGHSHIDLLKIDIEGAEHNVLKSMFKAKIKPNVLCIEIDRPVSLFKYWTTMQRIFHNGYRLIFADNMNYSFLRNDFFQKK